MENIFDTLTDMQKEQAREIHNRFFTNKTISVDEMRLLIRYEKFQLMLARADKERIEQDIANKKFDEIHTNDFSLKGMFKIAFKTLEKATCHLASGASGMHISSLEDNIAMLENTLEKWLKDPTQKTKEDQDRQRVEQILLSAHNFK